MLHRLGREELRDQIQPAIAKAKAVQDHGHRGGAHTHLLLGRSGQRIQIVGQANLPADARHDAQMIQPVVA